MNPFPALPFAIASKAASAGWKAAHQAVQSGALVVAQAQYEEAEAALKTHAAEQAKNYIRQTMQEPNLTPRQEVNLLAVYMHAYLNGALDAAAKQAGKSRE